jgi:hypothetical protein
VTATITFVHLATARASYRRMPISTGRMNRQAAAMPGELRGTV